MPSDRGAPNSPPSTYEYEVGGRVSGDDTFEMERTSGAVRADWKRRKEHIDHSVAQARFQGNAEASTSQSTNHWVSQQDAQVTLHGHKPEYHREYCLYRP